MILIPGARKKRASVPLKTTPVAPHKLDPTYSKIDAELHLAYRGESICGIAAERMGRRDPRQPTCSECVRKLALYEAAWARHLQRVRGH